MRFRRAALVLLLTVVPGLSAAGEARARPRFSVLGGVTGRPAAAEAWSYEEAFLGTARGSQARVRHDGGWFAQAEVETGPRAADAQGLHVAVRYGRDRLQLSEHLAPVHMGAARRYDLGELVQRRLTALLGTGFRVGRRLVAGARIGLVDRQDNTFTVAAGDPELPFAVGGALDIAAGDATLFFNPLEVDLRLEAGRRAFVLAGCAYDRLESPLAWRIAGAPAPPGARDHLALAGAAFHLGAGLHW